MVFVAAYGGRVTRVPASVLAKDMPREFVDDLDLAGSREAQRR
jgi:hypothetical protein